MSPHAKFREDSLPIFTKFCMPLRNVVVSRAILGQTGSRLPMCKVRHGSFATVVAIFSHGSSQKPYLRYN